MLFALERRAFKANKPEKWQTLYNEELPENTHSVNLKDKPGLEKGGTRKYEKKKVGEIKIRQNMTGTQQGSLLRPLKLYFIFSTF